MSGATIPIIEAIRSKRLLVFDYCGGKRVVEPHTYGIDRLKREMLCAYQIQGASRSGQPEGWKNFIVRDLADLRVDTRHFTQARGDYRRDDGAFREIFAQL